MTSPGETPHDSQNGGRAALRPRAVDAVRGSPLLLDRLPGRTGLIVFGVMGGLVAAYLVWLVVLGSQALQLGVINGWVGTAFRLAAGVACLIGGLSRRRGSYVPLVFGVALIFTVIGNTILTLWSLHGPPPPPDGSSLGTTGRPAFVPSPKSLPGTSRKNAFKPFPRSG